MSDNLSQHSSSGRWIAAFALLLALIALLIINLQTSNWEESSDQRLVKDSEDYIENTDKASSQETLEVSVLDQLLKKEWLNHDQWIRPEQEPPKSREEFVRAAKVAHDARATLLEQSYPAPLDEEGRYIVLDNNRFFYIDTESDLSYQSRNLYLHYEALEASFEKPVIRLMPSFAGKVRGTAVAHTLQNESNKNIAASFELRDGAIIFPISELAKTSDAWIIHVGPVNTIGSSARRYLVFLK